MFERYRFLGSGLFTQLNHKKWMHQKRLLSPAFHRGYLKGLVPQFNSVASTLVTKFTKVADGKTVVDMADELQKVTLDVIGKVCKMFGFMLIIILLTFVLYQEIFILFLWKASLLVWFPHQPQWKFQFSFTVHLII